MADQAPLSSLLGGEWQRGVDQANQFGQRPQASPSDPSIPLLLLAMGQAGDTLKKNAPLLAETAPGRIAKSLMRFASGGTPYAGPGLRREDYSDDPEARQPVEPMINDAMNAADVMSMGSLPVAAMRGVEPGALGIGVPSTIKNTR